MLFLHKYVKSLVVFLVLIQCSCSKFESNKSSESIDSLLQFSTDSLGTNPEYSFSKIKEAQSLAIDSSEFYRVNDCLTSYYITTGNFDTALILANQYLKFANKHPNLENYNSILMSVNNVKGIFHTQNNSFDSALYYYHLAYNYALKIPNNNKIIDISINIADNSIRKGDFVGGVKYYRYALLKSDSLKQGNSIKFPIYFGLGQAYYSGMRNFELSNIYFKKAEELYEGRSLNEKFIFCNNRGNFYYYKKEYSKALPWFLKAKQIVEPFHIDYYLNLCNCNLGDIYFNLNEKDSASKYLNSSYLYFKKMNNEPVMFYIATVKAQLAMKIGDYKQAEQLLTKHPIYSGVEPDILELRYIALQNYYSKIKNYKAAFKFQSNAVELNDSLRSERVKCSMAEIDARYMQDTTLIRKEFQLKNKDIELNKLRITNWLWILLLLFTIFVLLTGYLYFKRRKDQYQIKHLETISKFRLQNIRNRISPHFIFNTLNNQLSNNNFENYKENTYELIVLLRKSLELTEKIAISLADEIDFVMAYLKIESATIGADFRISWEIEQSIDAVKFCVPAMIMQIPIENALKHALRNKIGDKELLIEIVNYVGGVKILITDNGDGYNPTKQSNYQGTKTGLKVLYSTIQILNLKNTHSIEFKIDNREDGISGTKVEIKIPENFNFVL